MNISWTSLIPHHGFPLIFLAWRHWKTCLIHWVWPYRSCALTVYSFFMLQMCLLSITIHRMSRSFQVVKCSTKIFVSNAFGVCMRMRTKLKQVGLPLGPFWAKANKKVEANKHTFERTMHSLVIMPKNTTGYLTQRKAISSSTFKTLTS